MDPRPGTILHVDLDAFFAAVEQRDRPELRGKPVIVGGGGPHDRGVVSTASYEARVFGVRSAMPLRTAAALCPNAIFVPVDGRKYGAVSRQVMAILRTFTPLVEPVSIDEAFLDVRGTETLLGSPEAVARQIKAEMVRQLSLTISVGVATTRLVAKIASDLRKPDGLVVVPPGTEAEFLAPLPISRLWGVGERTRLALADYSVTTIGDLATCPRTCCPPLRLDGRARSTIARAASIRRRSAAGTRRSRSATSTPSTSTPTTGRRSSARCWDCPRASPGGCGRATSRRARSRSRSATRRSRR